MKKLLILSPVNPISYDSGARIRIYESIKAFSDLAEESFLIDFAFLDDLSMSNDKTEKFRAELGLNKIFSVPHNRSSFLSHGVSFFSNKSYRRSKFSCSLLYEKLFKDTDLCYDFVYCHFFDMFFNFPVSFWEKPVSVSIDTHNNDYEWYMSFCASKNVFKKLAGLASAKKFTREVKSVVPYVDNIICVSEDDSNSLMRFFGSQDSVRSFVASNGISKDRVLVNKKTLNKRVEKVGLFCGSLSVEMNVSALEFFVTQCLGKIRIEIPNFEFWIVGRQPSTRVKRLTSYQGVKLFGDVDSVLPYYDNADLSIMPFSQGGGSKLKLIESLARFTPVIATKVGLVGNDILAQYVIFADYDENDISRKIVNFFNSEYPELSNIRDTIVDNYSWEGIFSNLRRIVFS